MKVFLIFLLILFLSVLFYIFVVSNKNHIGKSDLDEKKKSEFAKEVVGRDLRVKKEEGMDIYKGTYFQIYYPKASSINKKVQLVDKKTTLEVFEFTTTDPRQSFTSQVISVSSIMNINDYPGVKFRFDKASNYVSKDIITGNINGLHFENEDSNGEVSAFFLDNNRVYTFAITGSDFKSNKKLFDEMIKSLEIKN